jgi:microcystin-dependent protein
VVLDDDHGRGHDPTASGSRVHHGAVPGRRVDADPAPDVSTVPAGGQPHNNLMPSLVFVYGICAQLPSAEG